jgi:predicted transcriptional regulator of viral defense system
VTEVQHFFSTHPIFRFDEFRTAHSARARRSPATTATVLKQAVKAGRLVNLRRGLYATVPPGRRAAAADLDPFVLACRLAPDATLAYRSALEFWGKSVATSRQVFYYAERRARPFAFGGRVFVPVLMRPPARTLADLAAGVVTEYRQGLPVRVTSLERALVDVLDVPRNGGTWLEIWRSLESIPALDLDFVVLYAIRLGSGLTAARVGFYLEQHRDALRVDERFLHALRRHAPRQPLYLDCGREPGRLAPGWNLVVPEWLLARAR